MAQDSMNLMSLTPKQIIRLITESIQTGDYSPMLILGRAGVGKTVTVTDVAKNLGIGYKEMRLVNMSEIDTYGLPAVVEVPVIGRDGNPILDASGKPKMAKKTMYIPPALLPDAEVDGEEGILALDEITSCSRTVRAAAYQLLDSKRALGDYKLPPKWKVIALGNGESDGGVFEGMEGAFLTRCTAYRYEADADSWVSWAMNNGINGSVLAYIKNAPDRLYVIPPGEEVDGRLFPCPRTWEKLSSKLNAMEERTGKMLEQDDVMIYAGINIGQQIAAEFSAFYAYNVDTVNPADILDGKISVKDAMERLTSKDIKQEVILLSLSRLSQLYTSRVQSEMNRLGTTNDFAKVAMMSDLVWESTIRLCNFLIATGDKIRTDLALTLLSDLAANCKAFTYFVMLDDSVCNTTSYAKEGGKVRNFDEDCPDFIEYAAAHGVTVAPNLF